jgi:hypothetical protein
MTLAKNYSIYAVKNRQNSVFFKKIAIFAESFSKTLAIAIITLTPG